MSDRLPVIGAVTVTFNSEDVLDDFLESARAQVGVDLRLYVVDSGSSDRTVEKVRAAADSRVVLIENSENVGFAEGSNQGIVRAIADGVDWILLINNDTRFDPQLVRTLHASATKHGLDVVSPLILATEPENAIWYAGGTLSKVALVARHQHEGEPATEAPARLTSTGFGSACCLLIKPEVFAEAGMFDPVYFVYFDDVDLASRVIAAGFQYWIEPKAVLVHKASALTGGKRSPFTLRWTARNWPLMIRKRRNGLAKVAALLFVQAWIFARVLLRRDPIDVFALRQRQFAVAMRMDVGGPAPKPQLRSAVVQ
jgi:GT2 family glycosyltransferase